MLFKVYFNRFCSEMNGEKPLGYVIVENKSARVNTIRTKVSAILVKSGFESVPFDDNLDNDSKVIIPTDASRYYGDEPAGTVAIYSDRIKSL